MGRHSAPDDDDAAVEAAAATTATLPALPLVDEPQPHGRHAVHDDTDSAIATDPVDAPSAVEVTDVLAPVEPASPAPAPAPTGKPGKPGKEKKPKPAKPVKEKKPKEAKPAKPAKPAKAKKPSGTRADLRLLRENAAVRARCIGAVLLAFLAYTIVIVVLGKADSYLFWLWVPIVVSGVLVGAVLDMAYRAKSRDDARVAQARAEDGAQTPPAPTNQPTG